MKYITAHDDGAFTVFSGMPEFGYELISVLPYAYNLYLQGKLKATVSGKDTACLYYFSPDHKEISEKRSYSNVRKMKKTGFPNISIHKSSLDWDVFSPPPLNEYYSSSAITFEKPTVVICNRINNEWDGEPINFIDNQTLEHLFLLLKDKYQVIYIDSAHFGVDYEDHVSFMDMHKDENIDKYDVLTLHDLSKMYPACTINEIQCRLYSGCDKFISSNGGLGILCSYFGGENIIFSKICHEHNPDVNSFHLWYQEFSKATITVIRNEQKLLTTVKDRWVLNRPLFNILIRTSNRPNYFHDCIKSIYEQSYSYYNIIVGIDSEDNFEYVKNHKCSVVRLSKNDDHIQERPDGEAYGIWFPFNVYFNKLLEYANNGFVIYLDDDDSFFCNNALEKLAEKIEANNYDLIFWRVKFPTRLVPNDENWVKRIPVCRDMSTIGYMHNINLLPTWEPWKRGDYRIAKYLHSKAANVFWFDDVLTGIQREIENGYGKCDDKLFVNTSKLKPLCFIIYASHAGHWLQECIDSIMSESYIDSIPFRVIVGVDGCDETFRFSKLMTRRYQDKVEIYYTESYIGPYNMKCKLFKKITRKDSLIFFLSASNIFVSGGIRYYYSIYNDLLIKSVNRNMILQMKAYDFSSDDMKKMLDSKNEVVGQRRRSLAIAIKNKDDEMAKELAISLMLDKAYALDSFPALVYSIARLGSVRKSGNAEYIEKSGCSSLAYDVFLLEYDIALSFLFSLHTKILSGLSPIDILNNSNFKVTQEDISPFLIRVSQEKTVSIDGGISSSVEKTDIVSSQIPLLPVL